LKDKPLAHETMNNLLELTEKTMGSKSFYRDKETAQEVCFGHLASLPEAAKRIPQVLGSSVHPVYASHRTGQPAAT
jgi:hypothetical protein